MYSFKIVAIVTERIRDLNDTNKRSNCQILCINLCIKN